MWPESWHSFPVTCLQNSANVQTSLCTVELSTDRTSLAEPDRDPLSTMTFFSHLQRVWVDTGLCGFLEDNQKSVTSLGLTLSRILLSLTMWYTGQSWGSSRNGSITIGGEMWCSSVLPIPRVWHLNPAIERSQYPGTFFMLRKQAGLLQHRRETKKQVFNKVHPAWETWSLQESWDTSGRWRHSKLEKV